jgi:hypothetical protein
MNTYIRLQSIVRLSLDFRTSKTRFNRVIFSIYISLTLTRRRQNIKRNKTMYEHFDLFSKIAVDANIIFIPV